MSIKLVFMIVLINFICTVKCKNNDAQNTIQNRNHNRISLKEFLLANITHPSFNCINSEKENQTGVLNY